MFPSLSSIYCTSHIYSVLNTHHSNAIQTLPLSLANCTSLERLHLGSNKIEYLPPEIFTPLALLKELHLYKNKIQTVPPEIGNLVGELGRVDICDEIANMYYCEVAVIIYCEVVR